MGIKNFFKKIGNGIRKAGRWIRDRALPAVGRIAKPILGMIGALPGHIGTIGRIGSGIAKVLHEGISKIPNEGVRDRLNGVISRGNEGFQRLVDGAKDGANRVNNGIGVARDIGNTIKQGINTQIKPAIPPKMIKPL